MVRIKGRFGGVKGDKGGCEGGFGAGGIHVCQVDWGEAMGGICGGGMGSPRLAAIWPDLEGGGDGGSRSERMTETSGRGCELGGPNRTQNKRQPTPEART